jgi:hypothetical protein
MMHVYYIRFLFIIIIIQFKLIVQKKSKEGNLIESNYSKEQNQDQAQKKNYLKFQLTKGTNSNNNNPNLQLMRRKSRSIIDFNNNFEEINIKEIYKDNDDNKDVPKLIQKFTEIKDCSIL